MDPRFVVISRGVIYPMRWAWMKPCTRAHLVSQSIRS
jgi:hypothetical protein